jgi:Peptidase family M28
MRTIFFVLSFLFATSSFAQNMNDMIKEEEVRRIIGFLASDSMHGRKIFTPGIEKSAAFIAEEFKKAGLETLKGSSEFLQTFQMQRSETIESSVTINQQKIDQHDLLVFASAERFFWNAAKDSVETIFVKAGENFIRTIFQIAQGNKHVLIVADTSFRRSVNRLRSFSLQRFSDRGNIVLALHPEPAKTYSVQVTSKLLPSRLSNVVGVLPGKSLQDEYVIFSAHYDHLGIGKPVEGDSIFNGANDDASGVTAVLSLAGYFSKTRENERTLLFVAFTAEESGGYGSRYFSEQFDPLKVKAMFNVEMIGTGSKWGMNSAYISGFEKTDFGKLLQENLSGSIFTFHPDPYPEQELFYRSDNATLARLGVPAHTISTSKMDSEPYYHTVNDEVETLDLKNMTEIIKAIAISSKGIVSGKQTPGRVKVEELR